jgi:hypothetical protein
VVQHSALKFFMEQTGEVLEARATRLLRMHNGDAVKAITAWQIEKGVVPGATTPSTAAAIAPAATATTEFTSVQVRELPLGAVSVSHSLESEIRRFFLFAVVPTPEILQVKIEGRQAIVQFSTSAEARQALKKSGDAISIGGTMHTVDVFASTRQLIMPPKPPVSSSRGESEDGHPQPAERPPETTAPDWKVEWSVKWGRWYWWHTETRETSWTDPAAVEKALTLAPAGQQQQAQQQAQPSLLASAVLDLTADDDSEDNDGKDDGKDEGDRPAAAASGTKDSMPMFVPPANLSPVKDWNSDDVIDWDQVAQEHFVAPPAATEHDDSDVLPASTDAVGLGDGLLDRSAKRRRVEDCA